MRGDAVRQAFTRARVKVGLTGFRFHDLRHTGQTLAASTDATIKDLIAPARARLPGCVVPVSSHGRRPGRGDRLGSVGSRRTRKRRQLPKTIVVKH